MANHCSGSKEAKVKIIYPDQETIVSKHPPINIDVNSSTTGGNYVDYTHQMNKPLDMRFRKDIADVQLNDSKNDWIYGLKDSVALGDPPYDIHGKCPTLGYAAVPGSETLKIDGNRLYSNFDVDPRGIDAYFNNTGTCTYRIFFGGYKLTINDTRGQIFSQEYEKEPQYEVACDNECPPGYCKCITQKYPGYCCLPCKEVAVRINNLAARL